MGRHTPAARRLVAAASLVIAVAIAAHAASPAPGPVEARRPGTPWPQGRPPTDAELREQLAEAAELSDRERAEEFLEAMEKGEDSEHVFVLQEWIDAGELDLDTLFTFGDSLFEHAFRGLDGYGDTAEPRQQRVHRGPRGGLDTFSCAGCHSVGGPNGAGTFGQNAFLDGDGERFDSANPRNPPALLGVGLIQALAAEMTHELQEIREQALEAAAADGAAVTVELQAKGVPFGQLTAAPDGSVDPAGVRGVSPDLVVRPFGWKGHEARLRRFIESAARIHMGIQSHPLAVAHRENPQPHLLGHGESWFDPDDDGEPRELEEGTLTAAAVYLAMLEAPVMLPPRDPALLERWAEGNALFDRVGCASCHRPTLKLYRNAWEEWPDTTGGPAVVLRPLNDGDHPKGLADVALYSDLRRHDMGPELADPHPDSTGLPRERFLTRPLWGLAETAPYLHDGRAATIPEAIEAHGGDAAASRDAFRELSPRQRASLHVFLLSLTRQPRVRYSR